MMKYALIMTDFWSEMNSSAAADDDDDDDDDEGDDHDYDGENNHQNTIVVFLVGFACYTDPKISILFHPQVGRKSIQDLLVVCLYVPRLHNMWRIRDTKPLLSWADSEDI